MTKSGGAHHRGSNVGTTMTADALATTAFVLGTRDGLTFLEAHEVDGMLVDADLCCFATRGMDAYSEHSEVSHVAR